MSELEAKDNPETFACESAIKNRSFFVFYSSLRVDLITEKKKWKKMLPRISTFWIFPLQLCTFTEKQKVAPGSWLHFCFSAEVDSYKGKIRKVDYRGTLFLFFSFSAIRSTHNNEQKTKKKQFLKADLHAKVSGLSFASSSDNLKKMFWDFLENFKFLKFLYKTAIIFEVLEF